VQRCYNNGVREGRGFGPAAWPPERTSPSATSTAMERAKRRVCLQVEGGGGEAAARGRFEAVGDGMGRLGLLLRVLEGERALGLENGQSACC
jgi:hypothetical protein